MMQSPLISAANSSDVHEYEEFMKGSVPCPTCRGSGRVPKEQEAKLIALIPVTDTRLNPRTKLKVCIAVILCLVLAGLTIFFLIPRSVSLSSTRYKIYPYYAYVNKTYQDGYVFLALVNSFNVTNDNYYPVSVSAASIVAVYDERKIATSRNNTALSIPLRSTIQHSLYLNITLKEDEGYLAIFCSQKKWMSQLFMEFDISVNSTYLGHTEQDILTTYQHVNCSATKDSEPPFVNSAMEV